MKMTAKVTTNLDQASTILEGPHQLGRSVVLRMCLAWSAFMPVARRHRA
jgi:hypothetical protein